MSDTLRTVAEYVCKALREVYAVEWSVTDKADYDYSYPGQSIVIVAADKRRVSLIRITDRYLIKSAGEYGSNLVIPIDIQNHFSVVNTIKEFELGRR